MLGVVANGTKYQDANTLPINSIGCASPIDSNATNYPPGVQRGEIETINMDNNGGTILQNFWERGGLSNRQYVALHTRCYTANTWYPWKMTPFSDSIADLASLLGVFPNGIHSTLDIDSTVGCFIEGTYIESINFYCTVFQVSNSNEYPPASGENHNQWYAQLAFPTAIDQNQHKLLTRISTNGGPWTSWGEINISI